MIDPVKATDTVQSVEDIDRLLMRVRDALKRRHKDYPEMTYEDGIECTLEWLFFGAEHPYPE